MNSVLDFARLTQKINFIDFAYARQSSRKLDSALAFRKIGARPAKSSKLVEVRPKSKYLEIYHYELQLQTRTIFNASLTDFSAHRTRSVVSELFWNDQDIMPIIIIRFLSLRRIAEFCIESARMRLYIYSVSREDECLNET